MFICVHLWFKMHSIMRVTGLVLAGGHSRRMGADKSALVLHDGRTLLQRQVDVLRQAGVAEILVARRRDQPPVNAPARTVIDLVPDSGPLGGIAAGLAAINDGVLLVLAVDVPRISTDFLRHLIALSAPWRGVVPQIGPIDQHLVATYPRTLAPLAAGLVRAGRNSVRGFAGRAMVSGSLMHWEIPGRFAAEFVNWNKPEDVQRS